jgi:hypothetical protein
MFMKTEFDLEVLMGTKKATAKIIGKAPDCIPYVSITYGDGIMINGGNVICIRDKDLERFAVNILKSLRSKKLNS